MELTTYNALDTQCDARDAVLAKVLQAQQLLREAATQATTNGLGSVQDMLYRTTILDASQEALEGYIDAKAWEHIIMSTGLYTCMHTKARAQWDKDIQNRNVPPLTRENIKSQLGVVHDDRLRFLEEGVVEVFKGLSYDYASNAPVKLGKRVVLEGMHYIAAGMPNTSNTKCSLVDDLARLMCVLDGKPENSNQANFLKLAGVKYEDITNPTFYSLHNDKAYKKTCTATIETPYYTLKMFKKGTAHIVFKRQDLVDKLNMAIHKAFPNALPAPV